MYDLSVSGRGTAEIETPALLLDMNAAGENIREMASFFEQKPCNLRPHFKTHKLPAIALQQMKAGAIGITCARLSEAEILLHSGIPSVLIANEIVGETKIRRLVDLSRYGELIVCIDDIENARRISEAATQAGVDVNVLIEVNVGSNRCGVEPGEPALKLLHAVSKLSRIRFRGVMGYEGGLFVSDPDEKHERCRRSNELLFGTAELLRSSGFPVEIVSAGGSNTHNLTGDFPGITEVQAGSYVTMDAHNAEFGLKFKQALFVLTSVISRPKSDRAVIDAGMKSISKDAGMPIAGLTGITLFALNEEHGHIRFEDSSIHCAPGDKFRLIPSHGCTTIPLHEGYYVMRGDQAESWTPILAR
jgi:D-serine deaminase-like pyridoxal phosphate-dependent protein